MAILIMALRKRSGVKLCTLLLLLVIMSTSATVVASNGDLSISWVWSDGTQLPIGTRSSSVTLNFTNQGRLQIRMEFVGLNFDWMKKDVYTYRGEEMKTIDPGQSVTYLIRFDIPANVTSGKHQCQAGIRYSIQQGGVWSGVEIVHFSPQDLEIIQTTVITVTSTRTVSGVGTEDWTVDFALLIAFTTVGLALLATFRSTRRKQAE